MSTVAILPAGRHDGALELHGSPVRDRLALCALGAATIGLLCLFDRRDQAAAAEEND